MIFFSLAVDGVVPQLGHVKAIDDAVGVGQQLGTRLVVRRRHVDPIAPHPGALLGRQQFQATPCRRFVASLGHRQRPRLLGVAQVGQDRHIQLVPLLEADLVDAHVGDQPRRIDRLGLGELQLDDAGHGLGTDAKAPGHLRFGAADQESHHMLLETQGVTDFLAFEGRNQVLAMMAVLATMKRSRISPEAGLAAHVQIANHPRLAGRFPAGLAFMPAALAAPLLRPRPIDLEAMGVAMTFIAGDGHSLGQIDVDGNAGHGRPWQASLVSPVSPADYPVSSLENPLVRENLKSPRVCSYQRKNQFS